MKINRVNNKFFYLTKKGRVKGFFNIYQAKNGGIYLMVGNQCTLLSKEQIEELNIELYSIEEFHYKCFKDFYEEETMKSNKVDEFRKVFKKCDTQTLDTIIDWLYDKKLLNENGDKFRFDFYKKYLKGSENNETSD